jgi:hypothetical protein
MKSRHVVVGLLAVGLLGLTLTPLTAQEYRGSILGTVTDTSGGVVAGAKVTVTNEATGTSVEARTNADGNYVVPFLVPATYTVEVSSEGFKAVSQKGVQVQVQDRITLRFKLEVGDQAETVEVVALAPMLQRGNADLGQVVSRVFLDRCRRSASAPSHYMARRRRRVGGLRRTDSPDVDQRGSGGERRQRGQRDHQRDPTSARHGLRHYTTLTRSRSSRSPRPCSTPASAARTAGRCP